MAMYFQPVGAPTRSAIGRAIAGGIDRVTESWLQRQAEEDELDRQAALREQEERQAGIVSRGDLRSTVRRNVAQPGPMVEVDVPQQSPIARAAAGPQLAGEAAPRVPSGAPAITQQTRRLQMAGPVADEVETEEHFDIGGGKVYAPGMDRGAVVQRARSLAESRDKERLAAEARARLIPAAERVRGGGRNMDDLLLLNAAGVTQKDLEDPQSVINREIAAEVAKVTAVANARQPFEIAEEQRREANEKTQFERELAARTAAERGTIDYRANTEARTGTGGSQVTRNINYATDRRTAPVYGKVLAWAQMPIGQRITDRATGESRMVAGNRKPNLTEIIRWLGQDPMARRLGEDDLIAIAAQAYKSANGMVDDEDFAGSGGGGFSDFNFPAPR